jgi:quercetin dioxygenase-like cupin family protein
MTEEHKHRQAYALADGDGWIYRFGIDFVIKAREVRDSGGVAVMEYVARKGEEPDDHTHPTEDEMFYVLEGALTFRCAEQSFDVKTGGFVFLPRGVKHGYTVHGDEPVRLLVVTAPLREHAAEGWGGFVSDIELRQGELISTPEHVDE